MSSVVILVACGFLTSILSAVFGVGGGVIVVPVLRMLFPDAPIQSIAATSLMVVMLGSLVNIVMFRRINAEIALKKLIIWCVAMLIGVQAGFFLSFLLSERIIMLAFAAVLILLALKTLFARYRLKNETDKPDTLLGTVLCAVGGMIAGITGLGGGSVLAPLISQLPSVGHKQIAVYTNWMMFIGGFGSMWSYLTLKMPDVSHAMAAGQIGYVNFHVAGIIFISSLAMSPFSIKLRGVLSERISRLIFALLLVVIAAFIFMTL
jgi:uncharacterized membrane protein YfcA